MEADEEKNEEDGVQETIEKTQSLLKQMEALKQRGSEIQARVDAFYTEQGLTPGFGAKFLTSDRVEPRDQYIFQRLLAELEKFPDVIAKKIKGEPEIAPQVTATLKSLNHKYRI